jgi:hypothetical protein
MVLSKKERELLEKILANDHEWYRKHFCSGKGEVYKNKRSHYRTLKSRINKKARVMKKDMALYNQVNRIRWEFDFI